MKVDELKTMVETMRRDRLRNEAVSRRNAIALERERAAKRAAKAKRKEAKP